MKIIFRFNSTEQQLKNSEKKNLLNADLLFYFSDFFWFKFNYRLFFGNFLQFIRTCRRKKKKSLLQNYLILFGEQNTKKINETKGK